MATSVDTLNKVKSTEPEVKLERYKDSDGKWAYIFPGAEPKAKVEEVIEIKEPVEVKPKRSKKSRRK